MIECDLLIVGGGISGLNTAFQYLRKNKNKKVIVIEKNKRLGGRIYTHQHNYKNKIYKFDAGAGRINVNHKNLIKLIKYFKLETIKIPTKVNYKPIPKDLYKDIDSKFSNFDDIINDIKRKLRKKPKSFQNSIKNYTLLGLVDKLYKPINQNKSLKLVKNSKNKKSKKKISSNKKNLFSNYIESRYHYWSELAVLNAEQALKTFEQDFSLKNDYIIIKGGLSNLINKLEVKLKKMNCKILLGTSLESVTKEINSKSKKKTTKNSNQNNNKYIINNKYKTNQLVLALQKSTLTKLIKNNKILRPINKYLDMLSCQPLYRIYAQYPNDKKTGKVWFDDIGKTTTNLEIKYIIPIDSSKGLIMISYMDGKYADFWNDLVKKSDIEFRKKLQSQLNLLFPEKKIPEPLWITHHYWNHGACYWKPKIDGKKMEKEIIKPILNENIFVVNSNFNQKQAWIEGGLLSSNRALSMLK